MSDLTVFKKDNLGLWVEPYLTNSTTPTIPQSIDSPLVSAARERVLGVLPMDSLIRNMVNAGDWIFLAFNASAGTELQSQVAGIQFSLHRIAGQSVNTFDIYILQCQEIVKALVKIYRHLLAGKEKLASIQLGYCAQIAKAMGGHAKDLAVKFEDLYAQSFDISRKSLELRNLNNAERLELTKDLDDFNARQVNVKRDQEQLLKDIDVLVADHCDSLSKIEASRSGFGAFVAGFLGFFGISVPDPRQELREQENSRYFVQMQRLQDQKLENLRNINLYAERIANLQSGISEALQSIETFHIVHKALSTIAVSLKEEAIFWYAMESYCNNFKKFKSLQPQENVSVEENIEKYSKQPFVNLFLQNLAQWVAVYGISKECVESAKNLENQVAKSIQESPSLENAKKQTPLLAQKLFNSINLQVQALEELKGGTELK